ncbi:MAG TPA: alpha/beta fold hydrolase [Rhodanobacteraceae bacterium]|nr:alpha/beta fold hydrolase [Rhodanobacteraceae bacterium]
MPGRRNLGGAALALALALIATGAVTDAAAATTMRIGSLAFAACELDQPHSGATTEALCAPFEVPENRAAPDARRIGLRLALIRSDAAIAEPDIVVFLAGGPGQAATEAYPQIAAALAPLRKHHHILLLDQRGTGGSNALTCKGASQAPGDADRGSDLETLRRETADCLAGLAGKADPRYYTTTDAVADLEAVRQALGAPQFDLVGVSYGTRVAQQYLRRHPDGVRSVVLDSVVPNELVLGSEFAVNLDAALQAGFAGCTQTPACKARFGDPYRALHALRDALERAPQSVEFPDPVSAIPRHGTLDAEVLSAVVRMFAYTPETAALLPLAIHAAAGGNATPLLGQSRVLEGDLSGLRESGMALSVLCSEDVDLLHPRPQDRELILGGELIRAFKAQCGIWPHGSRPADFHAPLTSAAPVLILEGELDPVTPPRYGEQVLKGLSHARLLVARGQGHNVIGRGCLPRLVGEFVEHLDPEGLDAGCIANFGPIPAFLDFNGAAP